MNDINTINNNQNMKNLPISKFSDIEKKDQSTSKTEISGIKTNFMHPLNIDLNEKLFLVLVLI